MSLSYLLDTNVVSEPALFQPNPVVLARLAEHGNEIAIAAVVWHELRFGCERLPPSKNRTRIEGYLQESVLRVIPILPYDEAAAAWHARERARLAALGRNAPYLDGQIAATAAVNNLILVTANRAHFANFEGLVIEDWRE